MKRETDPDRRAEPTTRAPRRRSRRWMIRSVPALFVLLLAVGAGPAFADGNANFLLGVRHMADDDFWHSDDQSVSGVMVDFGRAGWPIHLSLSTMSSGNESGGRTESVDERAVGVMKVWRAKRVTRPYVGGGIAAVRASVTFDQSGGDFVLHDTATGFYLDGGVFWRTGRRFNIGLGARLMTGTKIEIQGARGDANYVQLHVLAGWGWPRREKQAPASPPSGAP